MPGALANTSANEGSVANLTLAGDAQIGSSFNKLNIYGNSINLAGSTLTMIDAVRNLHALGVPFEHAVGAATEVPARFLARGDVGFLEPGSPADVVVLDDRLEILAVLCSGRSDVVARD